MTTSAPHRPSLRPLLLSAAIVGALPVHAQDAVSAQAGAQLDRVEVIGSNIRRADTEGVAPVLVLGREQIERTGLSSLGDVLQQLPASGKAINTQVNASGNFGAPPDGGGIGAGSTQVDLRHLESKRTLVLVDGRRWVYESSASGVGGAVDLNTIPLAIVERIEVLGDGASAIYGSDAIAGVINVVTRRSFDGVEARIAYGGFEQDDGETTRAEVTFGRSGERFDALLSASFAEQKAVASSDRDISAGFPAGVTRGSPVTPQGRFLFISPTGPLALCPLRDLNGDGAPDAPFCDITSAPGTAVGANGSVGFPAGFKRYTDADSFNSQPFNLVLTPNKRKSVFGSARYALTDSIDLSARALYNTRESTNQAAANPIVIGPETPGNGLADTIRVSRLNPFNPFGRDLIPVGQPGGTLVAIGRRPLEGGPRTFEQQVDTRYLSLGMEGVIDAGARRFDWSLFASTSDNRAEQAFDGAYSLPRIALALGDPAACVAVAGCTPLNLFGGMGADGRGTITPGMLGWIGTSLRDTSEQSIDVLSAQVSGDVAFLPAGTLSLATGVEHRRYEGAFNPDVQRVRGEVFDQAATVPTRGEYDVTEAFAEMSVPLLADMTWAKSLDATLAARWSDYSNSGDVTTTMGGLKWRPFDGLLLRGTHSEGFRAPFIGELFGLSTFGASINDPCSGYATSGNAQLVANCTALGIPTSYRQIGFQIFTTTGGNASLEPERSTSTTFGAVYSPGFARDSAWADRLDIEATYYRHVVRDAIQAPDAQDVLDACIATGAAASPQCAGITRNATGSINTFDNRLANIGRIETAGVDLNVDWSLATRAGRFGLLWQTTYVDTFEATDTFGNTFSKRVGVEANDGAIPRWRSNLAALWSRGGFSAGWTLRHVDDLTERCSDAFDNNPALSLTALGLCSDPDIANPSQSRNRLGSTTYHDLSIAWDRAYGIDALRLGVNVNNVFDKDPRVCLSCSLNGYDPSTYDVPGRFWMLQAQLRFQ